MSAEQIITVVQENSRKAFQDKVNALLSQGWIFHGNPFFQTYVKQDTWDGVLRCQTVSTYTQALMKGLAPDALDQSEQNWKEATSKAEAWCQQSDPYKRDQQIYCYRAGYLKALQGRDAPAPCYGTDGPVPYFPDTAEFHNS